MSVLTCLRVRVQLSKGSASDELVCEAREQRAAVVGELKRVSYEQDVNLKLLNSEFAVDEHCRCDHLHVSDAEKIKRDPAVPPH